MQRLDGLQWGRGIAALAVVLGHSLAHPLPRLSDGAALLGIGGVTLFFVISGFIMVVTTGPSRFDPGAFMLRRLLRIVPLYYLLTALTAVLVLAMPSVFRHTAFDPVHLVKSLLFIPDHRPGSEEIVPLLKLGWTLNFEMFFYAVFALLFWMQARARAIALTVLFGALALIGATTTFGNPVLEFYTRTDILSFVVGVWIGIAFNAGRIEGVEPAMRMLLAGAIVLLALDLLFLDSRLARNRVLVVVACAAAVWVLAGRVNRRDGAGLPGLVFAGDASYSIYLAHMFGIGAVVAILPRLVPDAPYAAIVVLSLVAGTCLGVLSYLALEQPMQRATRKWLKGRKRRTAEAQPAE